MAAKPKTQIITDIDTKIITNGDIKAVDTNAILKDILDCTELNGATNLAIESFKSTTALVDRRGGELSYALKVVKDEFVNITFKIAILETNVNNPTFVHGNPAIARALKPIVSSKNTSQIDVLVKIENRQAPFDKKFRVGSLNFAYNASNFQIKIDSQEPNDNLINGDTIFTSFTLHCPGRF